MVAGSQPNAQGKGREPAENIFCLGFGCELVLFVCHKFECGSVGSFSTFLVDDTLDDHGDLRAQLANQVDGHWMIAGSANLLIDHDLASIDLGAHDL